MKKGLVASYVAGITDSVHGEGYGRIIRYFIPEYITSLLLYSMPGWIDGYFIGMLQSTAMYGTLGATNNFIHLIIKIAEAFSVATMVVSGRFNGKQDYANAGKALRDAFWLTCISGGLIALCLYLGASWIYTWYVPTEMVSLGVPYLRIRVFGIFLMFVFFALAGFMRGIKNTKTPMALSMIGIALFLVFDYALVFGLFGLPHLGFYGSAVASIIQYGAMVLFALGYIVLNKKYRKYGIHLFSVFKERSYFFELMRISWPVMLDKATFAFAYVWLCWMMKPLGTTAVATFCVIKDMERFALAPAIAFAQVVTFLVSNDYGRQQWEGIKSNIKKVFFIASMLVFAILALFSLYPTHIIKYFDRKAEFTALAAYVFPIISTLVFFDVLQLILSGALRGIGNVGLVMWVRFAVCLGYFIPVSYILSSLAIEDMGVKLVLIYGSFYIGSALMSVAYIQRFRSEDWKSSVKLFKGLAWPRFLAKKS
jgi:MATE family multidrug resistance protein